jgi:hypothetical protein
MELFKNIRLKIGNSILEKKLEKSRRKVLYSDFSKIKSIGIVWDAAKTSDFPGLSRFCQKMHERNIDVKILGYFPGKELPDQYTAIRYLACFRKTELSFFYHPVSFEADHFIRNKTDVLIDVNFNNIFPLLCISSLSIASLKVGLFNEENPDSIFDLMIEIKKPVNIDNYLNQIVHYLEMINSGSNPVGKTVKPLNN